MLSRLPIFGLLLLTACSPPRAVEAVELLLELASPGEAAEGPSPRPLEIGYSVEGRSYRADLYRPSGRPAGALVLVPGLTPDGKADRRLTPFAATFARANFLVLVPDIESLKALRVGPEDAVAVADAVRHMTSRSEVSRSTTMGLAAISYVTGPAVLAALTPEIGDRLNFLLAIGGYHDVHAVLTFFTTSAYRETPDGPWVQGEANPWSKWVFLLGNQHRIENLRDRVLLRAIADRKLRRENAPVDDLVADLGPEGASVFALLSNRDPDRVAGLVAALPAALRRTIEILDLSRRDLGGLQPRLLLVHGRDDPIIPYVESQSLARAMPDERAELYLVDSMAHTELGGVGLGDGWTLWRAIYRVLQERDRGARAPEE